MKKITAIILMSLLSNISIAQNQDSKAENLGLISELVFIKLTSENLAIRIINDNQITEKDKINFVNLYNSLKVITDQIILQLIVDCRQRNSINYFKKIDNILSIKIISDLDELDLDKQKLKGYIKNLKKLNAAYKRLSVFKTSDKPNEDPLQNLSLRGFSLDKASLPDLTGVLSFVTATIKDIKESKEKKVEKIATMLNEVRLSNLEVLVKAKTNDVKEKQQTNGN